VSSAGTPPAAARALVRLLDFGATKDSPDSGHSSHRAEPWSRRNSPLGSSHDNHGAARTADSCGGSLLTLGYSLECFDVMLILLGSIRTVQGVRAGRAFRGSRPFRKRR